MSTITPCAGPGKCLHPACSNSAPVDPLPFLELPGSQERLARRIAELTAETMQPGLISGLLPADVGAGLRRFPPWVMNPSYLDYDGHQLIIKAQVKPELGGIELSLDWDGHYRRWTGTLRAEP